MSASNAPSETSPSARDAAQMVPFAQLVPDEDYQPRSGGLDVAHVALLAASDPATWPPLLVSPIGDGRYNIIDGFHRHAAAQRLGLDVLPCLVDEGAGYPEAAAANLRHGLPLSLADRKDYAVWLRKHEPHLSQRQIASRTTLSQPTISRLLGDALQPDSNESPADGALDYPAPAKQQQAVARVVSLFAKATRDREGIGFLGRDRRAELVRQQLVERPEKERPALAKMLHEWGSVLVEASANYAKPRR